MTRRSRNMSPSRIKYMLSIKGWTYADIDREYNLPEKVAAIAARYPHAKAEKAIASVLGKKPEQIWPARYNKNGTRLKPQPAHNYREDLSVRKDQKEEAA
ncbi:helix-turn-helix domain-containing protein [Paremcibacter congregatus]|uniref:helix-turn-helix domain-containing protein n=1 Tax=Paremcibacter congregatus TaxID=2043170 RepID=UPI0030EF4D9A